ncbi:exonuclease 1-like isoform X2 [Orbicella faveolata]|uniref:exonuclease 1-like isoform X2 n=1 Tax=Orbicella faveolata TaxID=48498 RepID=UPI0009E3AF5B|nr:exonuclease 1-like isoform X2 [Orbicella faveolata]
MGIQGLLPLLKPIQKPVSIAEDFAGQVIGVDAYCWLHKGAYGCAMELVEGKKSFIYVNYILKRINMLLHFNVKPILVFDGSYLPSKAGQEAQRRKTRQENKAKGLAFLRAGNRQQALECFQKCVDITPEMALEVIKECRKKGVDCIVAPYEADAQLAYLMKAGIVQAIISEDSDLLVYGCQKLIRSLRIEAKMYVPDDYEKSFKQADETFLYQLVFDPVSMKLVPLNELPEGLQPGDLEFAGPSMTREKATGIALGNINPISNEVMADFSPQNTKVINLGSDNKSDENSHSDASTPVSTSSFGHSVMNKRGKTGYDVQKNLSGLMLSSQPSANSRKPFVPPGQTRKTDEESLDDDSIFNMYTALKARPKPLSSHVPPAHLQRRATSAGSGHGMKRSKFKNPFKVCGHEVKSQDKVEISRYFNITGRRESSDSSSDAKQESPADETRLETEEDEGDTTTSSTSQPGGLLTILKDNMEEQLCDSELATNCSDDQDMEENDKENELRTCGESNESPIAKKKMFEYSKHKREEQSMSQESNTSQTLKCSPRQLQKQSVLTSHSPNIRDEQNANAEKSDESDLDKRFGYRGSMKTRKRDNQTSESLRQNTKAEDGIPVQSIEVIDVDSGYLSDTEMSTDGETPTPTQSGVFRLTPPSFGGNVPRMQGSAAGTKTMKKLVRLNSKGGTRTTGLGRCRSMGLTKKKSKSNSPKDSQISEASSTLFSYFEFDRRKKPRLDQSDK